MSLQINLNPVSVKAASNFSRESNLLSLAIHELSGSSTPNRSRDEVFDRLGDLPDQTSIAKKSTTKMTNAIAANVDKFEASISGMARMVRLSLLPTNDILIQQDVVSRSFNEALLEINQNSQLVLSVQANQMPNSVIKLLE